MRPCRIILVLLGLIPAAAVALSAQALAPGDKWTTTDPPINLAHIDFGGINRHGEAVGYHHRPNGVDTDGTRVLQIIQPPNPNGVYRARVAIRDPATGVWIRKKAPSTFFPDAMSDADVVNAILSAFRNGERRNDGQFVGPSGRGFVIEGWLQNSRINAAYPLRGP
jgi:hypothetical protein